MNTDTTNFIAEYKRRLAVMEAATTHNVELYDPSEQPVAWKHTSNPQWRWDLYEYRIKPKPKYRAWTIDEVPVGAVVRTKRILTNLSCQPGVLFRIRHDQADIAGQSGLVTFEQLLSEFLVSYDFCKTWQPCGVLES